MTVPFEPWHLKLMETDDRVDVENLTWLGKRGLAHTIVVEAVEPIKVIGVAGAVPVAATAGVAEVFMIRARGYEKHRIDYAKAVRRILDEARRHFDKIDALAAPGVPDRWFYWLGFAPIGGRRWTLRGRGA